MKSLKELLQTPQYWSAKLSTEIYNLYLNQPDTIGLTNRQIKIINDGEAAEGLSFEQIGEILEHMGFVLTYEIKKMDKQRVYKHDTDIDYFKISFGLRNILHAKRIFEIGGLNKYTISQYKSMKGLGKKRIEELLNLCKLAGIKLEK